ncbi:MAG: hypothetical protein AAFX40_09500, partial [Cyanobacteria bacterium J06639_1]
VPWPPQRTATPTAIASPSPSNASDDADAPNLTREVPTIPILPSDESTSDELAIPTPIPTAS